MKTSVTVTMAAMLGSVTWAATQPEKQKVVVCMKGDRAGMERARASASRLFRLAGVQLEWHADLSFCQGQPQAIMVSLMTSTPRTFHPGALAYALPYEGVHIQVFYDRIEIADPRLLPSLLANVIVHEISHILQGIDRHSESGIMKAEWNSADFTLMQSGQLRFTGLDVEMIDTGLAARATHRVPGTLSRPHEKFLLEPSRKFLSEREKLGGGTNRDEPKGTRPAALAQASRNETDYAGQSGGADEGE
jgi:hypothetical protein